MRLQAILRFKRADVTMVHLPFARAAERATFLALYELPHYPVFFDKALVCYGGALDEYLHERYPAPPLLPADPSARAHIRLMAEDVRSWYTLRSHELPDAVAEYLEELDPRVPFFTGKLPSLVDATALPILMNLRDDFVRRQTQRAQNYIARLADIFGTT